MKDIHKLILISVKQLLPGAAPHMDRQEAPILHVVCLILKNGLSNAVLRPSICVAHLLVRICFVEVDRVQFVSAIAKNKDEKIIGIGDVTVTDCDVL